MMDCNKYRIFSGRETDQIDGVDGSAADSQLYYWEPSDCSGDVLWSRGYLTEADATTAAHRACNEGIETERSL